ncbi:hypothetical protein Kisp02_49010 [Kineosporia sp. NBRC 101731]|nr:hypothetical protein [Kineosporia sp. NBRC 101731]GLY31536.1 hypothetical protein Kisp02_49010 [Kineosporia sp. NBRC 101731]
MELRLTGEGPKVIEVNPRICGSPITSLVSVSTGVNLMQEAIRPHCDLPSTLRPGRVAAVRGAAAREIFTSTSGTLVGFEGVDLARRVPGVIRLEIDGIGDGSFTVYGCDLTDGYIRINADYTT